jgi:hypothetical protein
VAAIATLSQRRYRDVEAVVLALEPEWTNDDPMKNAGVVAVAARVKLQLEPTRTFDLGTSRGILRVRGNGWDHQWGHFVAVANGQIYCPQFVHAFGWRDYLAEHNGRACTLLRAAQ